MSGTLRLRGATSGYSELQAPAVAADQTFVLPTAGGTLLTTDSPVPKLTLELGSASQPSLTFEGDTDTGLYSSGTNTLNLVTGGSDRLVIDSSGNIGIGTTSPSLKLSVDGDIGLYSGNTEYGKLFNDAGVLHLRGAANMELALGTEAQERLRIDSSGNVGIGTASPADVLHTKHSSASCTNRIESATSYAELYLVGASGVNYISSDNPVAFYVGASERMRIDSSGRLLVGTSSALTTKSNGFTSSPYVVSGGTATSQTTIGSFYFNNSASGAPSFCLSKSRSTTVGQHTSLSNNDRIGTISYSASDGSNYIEAARINAEVDGTPGTDDMPGRLVFSTTADGASSPTERVRIDSSGNVGIGTTSPETKLTVQAGSLTDGSILVGANYNGSGMSQNSDKLGAISFPMYASDTYPKGFRGIMSYASSGVNFVQIGGGTNSARSATDVIFYTASSVSANGSERMRIDSSGNVGIGTTSPSQLLDLTSTAPNIRFTDTIDGYSEIDGNAANLKFNADKGNTKADSNITFAVDNSERMRIDSSGQLLIGETSAADACKIGMALSTGTGTYIETGGTNRYNNGLNKWLVFRHGYWGGSKEVASIGVLTTSSTAGSGHGYGNLVFHTGESGNGDSGSTSTERMRISAGGDVSLTENQARFTLNTQSGYLVPLTIKNTGNNTSATLVQFTGWNNSVIGSISGFVNQTTYATSSDYRLKENVVDLTNATDRLKQLHPKRFNFIENPELTLDGFLAHEAQQVVSNAVTGEHDEIDQDGNPVYQGMDHAKLVPLLTAALQEALAKIETLEANNLSLENRIAALENN